MFTFQCFQCWDFGGRKLRLLEGSWPLQDSQKDSQTLKKPSITLLPAEIRGQAGCPDVLKSRTAI